MNSDPHWRLPMKIAGLSRFATTGGLAAIFLALPAIHRSVFAQPQVETPPRPADVSVTTLNDQTDLTVTVYNSSLALVRDVRQLTLPTGESRLKFMDIAASVNPATVHFRSITEPSKLGVFEQNYEYDLL